MRRVMAVVAALGTLACQGGTTDSGPAASEARAPAAVEPSVAHTAMGSAGTRGDRPAPADWRELYDRMVYPRPPADEPAQQPAPEEETPDAPSPPATSPAVAASLDAFAIDLLHASPRGQNLALSPAALGSAMALAIPGAKGPTRQELRRALHANASDGELLAELTTLLHRDQDGCSIAGANRAFVQNEIPLVSAWENTLRQEGRAGFERIHFGHTEAARARINDWVREQTESRIPEILPPGAISVSTRLALVSALSFTGKWAETFSEESTRPRGFLLPHGAHAEVETMASIRSAAYARVDGARLLELPYRCGDLAMLFVLPEIGQPERTGDLGLGLGGLGSRAAAVHPEVKPAARAIDPMEALARVERALSAKTLAKWIEQLKMQKVSIEIPRFEVEHTSRMDEILQRLGVRRAFTRNADFGGITTAEPLRIETSWAQAWVHVDEKGTKAAAAAAILFGSRGSGTMDYAAFHADHPFLFFLRDVRSGSILFLGRVMDPR